MTSLERARGKHEVPPNPAFRSGSRLGMSMALLFGALAGACVSAEPSRPVIRGTPELLASRPEAVSVALTASSTAPPAQTQTQTHTAPESSTADQLPAPVFGAHTPDASFAAFRLALRNKDYAAAHTWLTRNTVALDSSVEALANGVVALGLNQPDSALRLLQRVDPKLPLPSSWVKDLMAQGYGLSDGYLVHLDALRRSDNFANTLAVATRLVHDARWSEGEVFVNRAFGLANDFHTRGQARFLRAKLRLAQNRPSQALQDLRWLGLSNPHHVDSEQAFALLAQPPFEALNSDDRYLRANQLADHGLVEATDAATEDLRRLLTDKVALADLEYLRGLARYRKRMFAESVAPFDSAVEQGSHKADHARYLAARATARAGNPVAAIERFKPIARSTPTTETVSNSAFHIAREHSIAGNWEDAAKAYAEFQARFPNHEYAKLVEQDLLPVWFASGHYKRVVYWARQLREKEPERSDASLLRSIEALALARLGHTDFAKQVWQGLAQTAPLSFAGVVARLRLAELGAGVKAPLADDAPKHVRVNVPLPDAVKQLDDLGFSRQAEYALQRQEAALVRSFAPNTDAALCDAYAPLRGGRRRYELGFEAVKRRGFRDAPQLADAWLWHCYYPTPFGDSVSRHTQKHPVSPALVYAVMRQESAFLETVESHAGAHGLMQIIDPTARRIASELRRAYDSEDLNNPDHNIEFGVFYLNKLQSYFTHPALVAAAYNAGPEATARWFAAGRTLPLEVFVLRIPYEETRTYVQRVLANLVVYQTLAPEFPKVDINLEFTSALNSSQALPDALDSTPEDFY